MSASDDSEPLISGMKMPKSASDDSKPTLKIFGTDIGKIPCFRSTFLFSIPSGIAAGFTYFLFSSKARRAVHVGYFTFFALSIGYWSCCRYKWSLDKFRYDELQEAVRQMTIMDGTQPPKKETPELMPEPKSA